MLWIALGFGVCLVALFKLLNFIDARQMERDIAFILAESPAMGHSPMPSMSQLGIGEMDSAEIMPFTIDQCLEEDPA